MSYDKQTSIWPKYWQEYPETCKPKNWPKAWGKFCFELPPFYWSKKWNWKEKPKKYKDFHFHEEYKEFNFYWPILCPYYQDNLPNSYLFVTAHEYLIYNYNDFFKKIDYWTYKIDHEAILLQRNSFNRRLKGDFYKFKITDLMDEI